MSYFRIQDFPAAALLDGPQVSISYSTDTECVGKSVCRSLEDLAGYFAQAGVPLNPHAAELIELDGVESDEDDEDDDLGAILVHPTRIIATTPLLDTDFDALVDEWLEAHDIHI